MNRAHLLLAATTSLTLLVDLSAAQAQSLKDCGKIHVEAEAECEITGGVSCETMCTPVTVRSACAAKLTVDCDGGCSKLPSIECTDPCHVECMGQCAPDPGKFDCAATCELDCSGTCAGHCESSKNRAQCEASCEASCGVTCQGKCDVELPSANCDAKCTASCDGSCKVDANLDCQVDCQGKLYADCEVDVAGGCKTACESEEGAIFCDGQYVDHGDHLDKCVTAIEAYIDAHVDGYAEGSSSCKGGSCMAEGKAGATSSCSLTSTSQSSRATWMTLGALGLVAIRRRRTR